MRMLIVMLMKSLYSDVQQFWGWGGRGQSPSSGAWGTTIKPGLAVNHTSGFDPVVSLWRKEG